LVYTLAAYTITIGSLALYWVLQQHRQRSHAIELAAAIGEPSAAPQTGFNVGAALLAPVWMVAHGLVLPGSLLLLPCLAVVPLYVQGLMVPLLFVALVPISAGAALGIVGNRIAVAHRGLEDPAAFAASQLPWAIAGIVFHVLVMPWLLFFLMEPSAA
jgi:hypothetical protein